MIKFHAVMIDETGCEFGHSFEEESREAAWDYLAEEFPESRVDQLEDESQARDREERMHRRIQRSYEDPDYDYDDLYYDRQNEW